MILRPTFLRLLIVACLSCTMIAGESIDSDLEEINEIMQEVVDGTGDSSEDMLEYSISVEEEAEASPEAKEYEETETQASPEAEEYDETKTEELTNQDNKSNSTPGRDILEAEEKLVEEVIEVLYNPKTGNILKQMEEDIEKIDEGESPKERLHEELTVYDEKTGGILKRIEEEVIYNPKTGEHTKVITEVDHNRLSRHAPPIKIQDNIVDKAPVVRRNVPPIKAEDPQMDESRPRRYAPPIKAENTKFDEYRPRRHAPPIKVEEIPSNEDSRERRNAPPIKLEGNIFYDALKARRSAPPIKFEDNSLYGAMRPRRNAPPIKLQLARLKSLKRRAPPI